MKSTIGSNVLCGTCFNGNSPLQTEMNEKKRSKKTGERSNNTMGNIFGVLMVSHSCDEHKIGQ